VWDVAQGACQHTLTHHSDKVQAVVWNPSMASVLLTGGFDHCVAVADVRTPGGAVLRWPVTADVECAAWNPGVVEQFLVSTEDGHVACHDARKGAGAAPLFTLAAHDKPTSTLALCPRARGLLATGSTDKATKLWDISRGAPELLVTRDLRAGAVFSAAFSDDAPQLLAVAGAKGTVTVWDVSIEAAVAARWGAQLAGTGGAAAAAGPA
jgi:periodic tryptophan protein 1